MIDPDQVRNSYQLYSNGTLRVMYANGMSISFHSEPHVLAGTVTPVIGRCNISLPMENGLNSIEWRLRKEQIKGKVTVFGRKLRVSPINNLFLKLFFSSTGYSFFQNLKACQILFVQKTRWLLWDIWRSRFRPSTTENPWSHVGFWTKCIKTEHSSFLLLSYTSPCKILLSFPFILLGYSSTV